MMQSSKLLVRNRLLILSTTKWNSRRCLHTCLPLMNKDVMTIGGNEEQPHMRMMDKQKRMSRTDQVCG